MTTADDLAELYVHTVTVETRTGTDRNGAAQYATLSGPVRCLISDTATQVRDSTGAEVVAQSAVAGRIEDAHRFPPGSRVHLPARVAEVISVAAADGSALDLPSNFVAHLT